MLIVVEDLLRRANARMLWATVSIILSGCGSGGTVDRSAGTVDMAVPKSGTAVLSWDAVTDPNVAGYRIHFGTETRLYSHVTDVGKVTSFEVTSLERGTRYYFAATAYNISNESSNFSNEVFKDIP